MSAPTNNDYPFDVFLCYNSDDKRAVKRVGKKLRNKYNLKPWLDIWEMRPGLPWQRQLEQQIAHINSAAVFVGKSGIGPWQRLEIDAFLREFVSRGCPVIPLLLRNAPQKPVLPVFLQSMRWVDFREHSPGDFDQMEQLVWGITGNRPEASCFDSNTPIGSFDTIGQVCSVAQKKKIWVLQKTPKNKLSQI